MLATGKYRRLFDRDCEALETPREDLLVHLELDGQKTTINIAQLILEVRDQILRPPNALVLDEGLQEKIDEDDGFRRRVLRKIISWETPEKFQTFCLSLRTMIEGVFANLGETTDPDIGWKIKITDQDGLATGADLIARQMAIIALRHYVGSIYKNAVSQGIDPRTKLPVLETLNEQAFDTLKDGQPLALGTMDLAGMGALNLAFGDNLTDSIVETKIRMIAEAVAAYNADYVVGRRQRIQGDELVLNLIGVTKAEEIVDLYEKALLPALDAPLIFYIDDEQWARFEASMPKLLASKDKKENEAGTILSCVLWDKSEQKVPGHRAEDRDKNLYRVELQIGGRGGFQIINPVYDGVKVIDDVANLRTYVQRCLEGGTARHAQYELGLRNPVAICDLDEAVSAYYDKGGRKAAEHLLTA